MAKHISSHNENKVISDDGLLLLIDKPGNIGKAVLEGLYTKQSRSQIVFVTSITTPTYGKEVFSVPYKRKLPLLPNAKYDCILIVYNGEKEILEALESLVIKAEESKARIILVIPLSLHNARATEMILEAYKETTIMFVGDVFSQEVLQKDTTIQRFFDSAKEKGSIVIHGMGLDRTFPVFLEDVARGIREVIMHKKGKEQVFFLFQKYPPTRLGLARMFQKIDPLLRIDFIGREEEGEVKLPEREGVFLLVHDYPLQTHVKDVYESSSQQQVVAFEHEKVNNKEVAKSRVRRFTFFTLYFLLVFLFLPTIATAFFSFAGLQQLHAGKKAIEEGNIFTVQKSGERAHALFTVAHTMVDMVTTEASLLSMSHATRAVKENIFKGDTVALIMIAFGKNVASFHNGEGISAAANFRQASILLQQMKAEKKFPNEFPDTLEMFASVIEVMPDVLGFSEPRTYLVLFQNNMELRPGGGFIGSYGIIKVDKGKMVDFVVYDIYDADGQLKGHVEPPFAIRRYLPSVHWYFRDSNFSVDFQKNASAASFFLKTETGVDVDGVIAVDVSFVKLLLAAVGGVEVPDYKETVTADNVYELAQKHAQQDFFPGSSQKKDFLRSLFKALQMRFSSPGQISYTKLIDSMGEGVKRKHVLFWFTNPAVQSVFTANRMSSSLWDEREEEKGVVRDFLGISEANLGVNKVNYFIDRKVQQDMVLTDDKKLLGKLTLIYKNTAEREDYKNYLRVMVPLGTKLTAIVVDGVEQGVIPAIIDPLVYEGSRFAAPKGLEVEQVVEQGKQLFGMLVVVPKKKETTVVVSYEVLQKEMLDTSVSYSLWLFKQPGIEAYPYTFSFFYPESMRIVDISEGFGSQHKRVFLTETLSQDTYITIRFAKK